MIGTPVQNLAGCLSRSFREQEYTGQLIKLELCPASHDKPDDKDDHEDATDPASDRRATIIKATSAAKKNQQDQNNQNSAHTFA